MVKSKTWIVIAFLLLLIVGGYVLVSGGTTFQFFGQKYKDYSLNQYCQDYDGCLNYLKQQFVGQPENMIRQAFDCDENGCFMWVTIEEDTE